MSGERETHTHTQTEVGQIISATMEDKKWAESVEDMSFPGMDKDSYGLQRESLQRGHTDPLSTGCLPSLAKTFHFDTCASVVKNTKQNYPSRIVPLVPKF